jgi:hypothetical protein
VGASVEGVRNDNVRQWPITEEPNNGHPAIISKARASSLSAKFSRAEIGFSKKWPEFDRARWRDVLVTYRQTVRSVRQPDTRGGSYALDFFLEECNDALEGIEAEGGSH